MILPPHTRSLYTRAKRHRSLHKPTRPHALTLPRCRSHAAPPPPPPSSFLSCLPPSIPSPPQLHAKRTSAPSAPLRPLGRSEFCPRGKATAAALSSERVRRDSDGLGWTRTEQGMKVTGPRMSGPRSSAPRGDSDCLLREGTRIVCSGWSAPRGDRAQAARVARGNEASEAPAPPPSHTRPHTPSLTPSPSHAHSSRRPLDAARGAQPKSAPRRCTARAGAASRAGSLGTRLLLQEPSAPAGSLCC